MVFPTKPSHPDLSSTILEVVRNEVEMGSSFEKAEKKANDTAALAVENATRKSWNEMRRVFTNCVEGSGDFDPSYVETCVRDLSQNDMAYHTLNELFPDDDMVRSLLKHQPTKTKIMEMRSLVDGVSSICKGWGGDDFLCENSSELRELQRDVERTVLGAVKAEDVDSYSKTPTDRGMFSLYRSYLPVLESKIEAVVEKTTDVLRDTPLPNVRRDVNRKYLNTLIQNARACEQEDGCHADIDTYLNIFHGHLKGNLIEVVRDGDKYITIPAEEVGLTDTIVDE